MKQLSMTLLGLGAILAGLNSCKHQAKEPYWCQLSLVAISTNDDKPGTPFEHTKAAAVFHLLDTSRQVYNVATQAEADSLSLAFYDAQLVKLDSANLSNRGISGLMFHLVSNSPSDALRNKYFEHK